MELNEVLTKLYIYFDLLNQRYFDDVLEKPIITVQKDGSGKRSEITLGWCSLNPIWNQDGNKKREINICAESLARPITAVLTTLQHELIHLYCGQMKIIDCSGATLQYHNKKFKVACESRGLIVEKNKYGWSHTTPNDEFIEFVKSIGATDFTIYRDRHIKPDSEKKESKVRKYLCSGCGAIARATKEIHIRCEDCDEIMEEEI